MKINEINESQRKAAKVAGFVYLLVMIPAFFAEFYVLEQLINYENAAETAQNIAANERLFRFGIAANLLVWIFDVVLITALYVILEPVNRNLALLGLVWRIIETAVLVNVSLSDLDVLRILSGAEYLRGIEAEQLQTLARLSIGAHHAAYNIGLVFLGLGSAAFGCLWLKSRFIPRGLSVLGLCGSLLLAMCAFAFFIFPELRSIISVGIYTGPIFIFEISIGFWLLLKGIRTSEISAESQ